MRLLKKLRAIFSPDAADNESPDLSDPRIVLVATSRDLLRLAEQIQAHAERAPYQHITDRLKQIALEKRKTAKLLKEKISDPGGELTERPLEIKSGKNHWERMVR